MQLIADVNRAKNAPPHPLSLFHPWLKNEPIKKKPFKPADLRAVVAQAYREKGLEPPPELLQ